MQLVVDQLGSPLRIIPPEPLTVEQFWHISSENPVLRMEREAKGDLIVLELTKIWG